MVDAEFESIWKQVEADKERGELAPEDEGKSDDELKAEYRKIAERRVRLGLVLAEVGRRNNVVVSDQELNEAMRQEALRYGAQAQQIFDLMRQNANAQASLRAPIFEEKVVDLILSRAQVADKPVGKDELLAEDEMPEGYGEAKPEPKAKAKASKPAKAKAAQSAPEEATPEATESAEAAPPAKAKTAKPAKAAKAAEASAAEAEKPAAKAKSATKAKSK
jgi:trigger factor